MLTLLICIVLHLGVCYVYPANQSLQLLVQYDQEEYVRWLTYWLVLFLLHSTLYVLLASLLLPYFPEIYYTFLMTVSVLLSFPNINASAFIYNYALSKSDYYLKKSRALSCKVVQLVLSP